MRDGDTVWRTEFANRLQAAMIQKGWHKSELARQASKHASAGQSLTRDMISKYIHGKTLPTPLSLDALCKALGKKHDELLPSRGRVKGAEERLALRDLGDGTAWLSINQAVPWAKAVKIMELLRVS